ncbi:MAG TPA: hypothetical protein VK804_12135 [Bradyrhizobium sp.]|uniref:hypothetical protein n=1 Tax=Bradyrhizobium sp. TaxID=376 RepID=UPI002C774BDF|nr:hypothetical protein [Bradyrhizobium sp.]HTB01218.1 hypothetical protein [Bradyrhizobium sp.]
MVKAVEAATDETSVDGSAAKAHSAATEAMNTAATSAKTVAAATSSVATSAATTTAASQRHRRLNQSDRGHCQKSHHQFPRHASLQLHEVARQVWDTVAGGLFGDETSGAVN